MSDPYLMTPTQRAKNCNFAQSYVGRRWPIQTTETSSFGELVGSCCRGLGVVVVATVLESSASQAIGFVVTTVDAPATAEGDTLEVTVEIANTGDVEDTQTVGLDVVDLGSDESEVTLGAGESTAVTLTLPTNLGDAGEYMVRSCEADC